MTKRPHIGGHVQISGVRYRVLDAPARDHAGYRMMVQGPHGIYIAIAAASQCGKGPWMLVEPYSFKPKEQLMERFYMVLSDRSNTTNVRHPSEGAATAEARRLAALNPGVKFFVLQSIGHAVRQEPVAFVEHDAIPF